MVFTLIIVLINFVSLTYLLIFTGTKVRVSKNTGTIIPKPDPMANRKPRSSMIGPKDTLPEDVFAVTYEVTGSELIALLKESEEIKINKPIYNRAQRKTIFQWALYPEKDENGYLALKIQKADGRKKEITSFTSLQEGKNSLLKITEKYNLCQKINGLYETKNGCFQYKIKECNGACLGKEVKELYNERVEEFIQEMKFENDNMIIVDRGRTVDERCAILIENGIYKGYCFYDLNYQINNIEILKTILIPMQNNRDTRTIIQAHLRRNKVIKIIKF